MKKMITLTIFMAIALAIASFGIKNQQEQIVDFVYERDAEDISQIIYDHWNWIFRYKDIKNQDKILQKELWEKNRTGELHTKVLRNKKRVIGLMSFRKKDTDVYIRLITIAKDFQRKEYCKKLIIAVVNDLLNSGCTSAHIFIHKDNKEMHTQLENVGFKKSEKSQDTIEWFKKANISPNNYLRHVVTKETFKTDAAKINFRIFLSLADYSVNFCLYFINSIIRNWPTNNQNKPSLNFET